MLNLKTNNLIVVGVISTILGIILLSNNYINSKVDKAYSMMNLQVLAMNKKTSSTPLEVVEKKEEVKREVPEVKELKTEETKVNDTPKVKYVGKLSIPKISLERPLAEINSKYNSVNYGVETLKGSTYPNTLNGNLILLSHSGTSYRSHFRNLYKLSIGDKCYIEYLNKTYTFIIKDIYQKPKTGKVAIYRDYNKTTLTLITCTKDNKTTQTIYIAELI